MAILISRRELIAGTGLAVMSGAAEAAEPPEDLKLAVSSTSFVLGGVKIGEQAGLFVGQGLNLGITVMESGNAAMAALIGGSVPFAVSGPPDALMARSRGQDVVIVANLYAGFAGAVVLASSVANHLGVAPTAAVADRFRALDGLVLAVPSATSALVAPIREGATAAGAKIRFTYMAQGAMPAALETNAIQGMVASFPFAGTPLLRGSGVLWINGPTGDLPAEFAPASSSCVQATGTTVTARPATVRKLQNAVKSIAEFIENDPKAAKQALAASYPQLGPQDIDLAFDQQWRNWTKPYLSAADMRQELKLLLASTKAPGLDRLDPASALIGPQ